ncbi:hypothetical protein F511_45479 [Dorcoceras hygrometricum]|uniref:Uncharacterized protein n=1 Tax=Dorcoceras hygrometricum TaxID=472368 RepID=A0A2Z6ZWC9_9LAMI|nr:hypothetical protein F511_45479 [Dorcoceras hygrometricum]
MVHASPVDCAIMREGGAPLSAALRGQRTMNGRTAAGYGRPSRAQQLAQDSLPSSGQQVRDRAAARAQSRVDEGAAAHGGGRRLQLHDFGFSI